MAAAASALDEGIKEYLLYRGFTQTLKQFELEKKEDKDKGFRVNRIVDYILQCIYRTDLPALQSFWIHVNKRFFSHLSHDSLNTAFKLETNILKLFLAYASKQGRQEEIRAFFDRMCDALHERREWKDWFALPFTKYPDQHPSFRPYFSKEWMDAFIVTLHNFFSTLFTSLPLPSLLNFESENQKMDSLTTENKLLHTQLAAAKQALAEAESNCQRLEKKQLYYEAKLLQADARLADQVAALTAGSNAARRRTTGGRSNKTPPSWTKKSGTFSSPSLNKKSLGKDLPTGEGALSPHSIGHPPYIDEQDGGSPVKLSGVEDDTGKVVPAASIVDEGSIRTHWDGSGAAPFLPISQEAYEGHNAPITLCKFSPNATQVASVDTDGVMRIWDPSSEYCSTSATVELSSSLLSLDWVPQSDNLVLIGSGDGIVKLYDCSSSHYHWEVNSDPRYPKILSIACSPSSFAFSAVADPLSRSSSSSSTSRLTFGLTAPSLPSFRSSSSSNEMQTISKGSTDTSGEVFIWDLKTQKQKCSLPLAPEPVAVNCMAFNHNSNLLIAGGADGIIRLYDVFQEECLFHWTAHQGEVYSLQFSSDETSVYSMGKDGKFFQWSVMQSGAKITEFKIHGDACRPTAEWQGTGGEKFFPSTPRGNLFAFESEDKYVLTCSAKQAIVYQVGTEGKLTDIISITGHSGPISCVDWLPGRRSFSTCITGSVDSTVKVTNLLKNV